MLLARPARWLVLPDMQVPYHDKRTLAAVMQYASEYRWDGCINLGDFLDFNEISRWEEGNARSNKTASLARSYEAGRAVLDNQLQAVRARNRSARYVLIEGNHDARIHAYLDKNPEAEGLVEVPVGLELAKRRVEWVPYWTEGTLFRLGNAYFAHGRATSKYHAASMLDKYGVCLYYGHTHDIQTYSKERWGDDKTLEAGSLGCLCRYDQGYLQGSPTSWQQAFAVFHVLPSGYYQRFVVRVFNHRFISPEGVEYHG